MQNTILFVILAIGLLKLVVTTTRESNINFNLFIILCAFVYSYSVSMFYSGKKIIKNGLLTVSSRFIAIGLFILYFQWIEKSLIDLLFSLFDQNILLSMSLYSLSIEEFIRRLKLNIKHVLSEGVKPHTILKRYSDQFGAEFIQSVIDEYFAEKAAATKEERLAKRREKAAAKKEALQKFFKSDLYGIACSILGFDIKTKLKSIAMNSKWITIPSHPEVDPASFTMNHFTLDIEAYKDDKGNFVPYLFGIYGQELGYRSFYGEGCVGNAIKFILNYNYSSTEVTYYAHNSGRFDSLYIIKQLNDFGVENMRVLRDKNNSLFLIEFEYNGVLFKIKDSFKLLPLGLDKLLKDFSIDVDGSKGKLPFDHSWVNSANLYYKGSTPEWLSHLEGELINMGVIINGEFSIQKYCELYNKIDCIGLHKLICKFFYTLVSEFKIDFSHCVTLPQLSLDVFRSKFLKSNKLIRLLSTHHHNFIKKSYIGSIVSVFKPFGEHLYHYDINSLYPYVMAHCPMPSGTPRPYDCSKGLGGLEIGFAEAEVVCPEDLKIPVLGIKVDINGSSKLIYPTGTFRGVFFSEELRYAESLGYKIKLIRAYSFNKSYDLFSDYVSNFYQKKTKGSGAVKAISKLMLNSLYGRFGMAKEFSYDLITSSDAVKEKILNLFTNISVEPLDSKSVLFNFSISPNINLKDKFVLELLQKLFNKSTENRIGNIALASAITACARIEHHKYMQMYKNEIYYADTDSLVLSKNLDPKLIGDKIGQFKNVLADENYSIEKDSDYYISKGLFLRDKVYSLVLRDNTQITRFSGLNRRLIPTDCFNLLYNAYLTGDTVKLKNELLRRDINNLMVSHVELDKVFTFNYDKRVQIYKDGG